MRYVTNPEDIVSKILIHLSQDKDKRKPVVITFASWMEGVLAQKSWSDGPPAEARAKLLALSRIMKSFEQASKAGDEWGIESPDFEILEVQARAFEVAGEVSAEKPRIQLFKLAIVTAADEPRAKSPPADSIAAE
jgi:hypothetical protein